MRHLIKTGELVNRIKHEFGLGISKRKLQRWVQQNRLPPFLDFFKTTRGGHYRWNWPKIYKKLCKEFRRIDIEILAKEYQSINGGDIEKIKRKFSRYLKLCSYFSIPYFTAIGNITMLSHVSKEDKKAWEEMDKLWRQEMAPRLVETVSERLRHGKFDLL